MKRVKLSVPAMQSEHCQNRVKTNIESLRDLKISTIKPGHLSIDVPDDYLIKNLYLAIESAGYQIMSSAAEILPENVSEDTAGQKRTLYFTSNIKCMGCVEKVAPVLNESDKIDGWNVDILNVKKILTVESDSITEEEVQKLVQSSGFNAEPYKP